MPTPPAPYALLTRAADAYHRALDEGYHPPGPELRTGGRGAVSRAADILAVEMSQVVNPPSVRRWLETYAALGGALRGWPAVDAITAATQRHRYADADPTYPGYRRTLAAAYDPDAPTRCPLSADLSISDGVVLAFSDAHWHHLSQRRSLAHEAMLIVARHLQPTHLLSVGDLVDFESISRHAPVMWRMGPRPTVRDEIEACAQHLHDLHAVAPNAERIWVRGNHDDRFDRRLADKASEFEGINGAALSDHFEAWRMCWRLQINNGEAVATHRQRNGVHAAWNNLADNGCTTITGDTHALKVVGRTFNGRRAWGVELGMLADPNWPIFNYRLGAQGQQQPGFAVLTWRGGALQPPELCEVVQGAAYFRGQFVCGRKRVAAVSEVV